MHVNGIIWKIWISKNVFSEELGSATNKLIETAKKYNKTLGIFLFGTDRVAEFMKKGFNFFSVGNDLHHVLTQSGTHMNNIEKISKEEGKEWKKLQNSLNA